MKVIWKVGSVDRAPFSDKEFVSIIIRIETYGSEGGWKVVNKMLLSKTMLADKGICVILKNKGGEE